MNRFEIITKKKTITRKKMDAFVEKVKELAAGVGLEVELKIPAKGTSRADRLNESMESVRDAIGEVECLKDELQAWFDNLPENLQGGDKGSALEEAISSLETLQDSLDNAVSESESIEFPGMY